MPMPKRNASTPRFCPMISVNGSRSSVVAKVTWLGCSVHLSLSTGTSCDDFLGIGDSVYFLINLRIWA